MPGDAPNSIVIVDRSHASGYRLRESLSNSNVTAHVFNAYPPALAMIHRKKIDTVIVEFDTDKETLDFCSTLKELNIPVVFTSAPVEPFDLRQYGFQVNFPTLPRSPTLRVQYAHPKNGLTPPLYLWPSRPIIELTPSACSGVIAHGRKSTTR